MDETVVSEWKTFLRKGGDGGDQRRAEDSKILATRQFTLPSSLPSSFPFFATAPLVY